LHRRGNTATEGDQLTRLRNLGIALAISLTSMAILSSSAFATASTDLGQWYVGGSALAVGSTANATCALKSGTSATIVGVIGSQPFELQATGVNCINWKIKETQVSSQNMAVGEGQLEFTGISVVKPPCTFTVGGAMSTTLKTTELQETVQMEGTTTYLKLAPASGIEIARFELASGCSGTHKLVGTAFGKTSPTTTSTALQPAVFSGAINETAGGGLGIDTNTATLTAEINFSLTSGSLWTANRT
jgi:hypothetical protein